MLAVAGTARAVRDIDRVEVRAGDLLIVGRRRLPPGNAAQARRRPDHDPRRRQDLDRLRRTAADPRNDQLRIRPPRRGRHHRPAGLHGGQAGGDRRPAARRACPGAIVGKGSGTAIVKFPEQAPIPASSPITIFNGPKKHGNPTVLAHAFTTVPVATTFIVPVEIEKIHKGIYGYRTKARIPKIAGGDGVPISGN